MKLTLAQRLGALLGFQLLGLIACNEARPPAEAPPSPPIAIQQLSELLDTPEHIRYEDIRRHVFEPQCLSCHDQQRRAGGIDLSSYQALLNSDYGPLVEAFSLEESLLIDGLNQPKPGCQYDLDDHQELLLKQWVSHGAAGLEEGVAVRPKTIEESLAPYFQNPEQIDYLVVNEWVFRPGQCLKCHSAKYADPRSDGILFGVDMTDYASLKLLNGIVPGLTMDRYELLPTNHAVVIEGSNIYKAISVEQSMPPPGYRPLHPARIKLLELWINNCAPETRPSKMGSRLAAYGSITERCRPLTDSVPPSTPF